MKTIPVRINAETKEQIENAIRQYRHKTGNNISVSEAIDRLLIDTEFKQLVEWRCSKSYKQQ